MKRIPISLNINGRDYDIFVWPWQSLLSAIRDDVGLTGCKEGCGNGNCGSCTLLVNGFTVDSCLMLAAEGTGKQITTIEGMANGSELHPLQKSFIKYGALQCGICTPGFLMSAKHLLDGNPKPTEHEIRAGIAGNLCRCTGYDKIVRAIQAVAEGETFN